MPRFFFDFCQGDEHVPDEEGIEFASTEQAYMEAVEGAREMWSDLLKKRRDPNRCRFEVRDAGGNLLFTFPFHEVVESCLDRPRPSQTSAERATAAAVDTAGRIQLANDQVQKALHNLRAILVESRTLLKTDLP